MKPTLVQSLALTDREQLELVVVVRDDGEVGIDRLPVDGQADAPAVAGQQEQRSQLRERVSPAPVALTFVHEERVEPQRDVVEKEALADSADVDPSLGSGEGVQRAEWIVAVQPEVSREVVTGAERDADERQVALERDLGDCGERAVAAGDAECFRFGVPGELGGIVARLENPCFDPAPARFLREFLRARAGVARARIDQEQSYASTGSSPSERSSADFGWAPIAAAAGSPSLNRTIAGMEAIP
jgi:hypothetical protein